MLTYQFLIKGFYTLFNIFNFALKCCYINCSFLNLKTFKPLFNDIAYRLSIFHLTETAIILLFLQGVTSHLFIYLNYL